MEKTKHSNLITLQDVRCNPTVITYIRKANENLAAIGFTEHGRRHADLVATTARRILLDLGYSFREAELAAIAGYLHDIGNVVGRTHHYATGALMAMNILQGMSMDEEEIADVASAIGNHDEEYGQVVSNISAAVILADKADVHRSRVRNRDFARFDIHDRVNYAVQEAHLDLDTHQRVITLQLTIDTYISRVMEYFEIFLSRMVLCRRAADFLSACFALVINEVQLL
ncbi:MAG: HD domain-containing protein [Dethiobacteria bacterium]|jgi:metal-dependent HD superfamily phosphatase/phosphodiesterase